jgi:hypothetical protein
MRLDCTVKHFLDEIQATLDCGIWAPALASALLLPDACGAIDHPGLHNRERYPAWYDKYVEPVTGHGFTFNGKAAWMVRNGIMHETAMKFTMFGFDRVVFSIPNRSRTVHHWSVFENNGGLQESILMIHLPLFCLSIMDGVRAWMDDIAGDTGKQKRLAGLIQMRSHGLPPHFIGLPVIM